jgi:RNA polymerase sigma-70 factor (ECF subfamily)
MNDEAALLRDAKRLDQKALAAVFDTYAPVIYNYVLRVCRDSAEADNIVGEVFAKLVEQIAAGQGPVANLKVYLFQIAYYCAIHRTRRDHLITPFKAVTDAPGKSPAGSMFEPAEERSILEFFRFALNSELTEIQRHVIILRFMENFSLRETAVIVGKKINYVKVIQTRAVTKLRESLGTVIWPNGKSPRDG